MKCEIQAAAKMRTSEGTHYEVLAGSNRWIRVKRDEDGYYCSKGRIDERELEALVAKRALFLEEQKLLKEASKCKKN